MQNKNFISISVRRKHDITGRSHEIALALKQIKGGPKMAISDVLDMAIIDLKKKIRRMEHEQEERRN